MCELYQLCASVSIGSRAVVEGNEGEMSPSKRPKRLLAVVLVALVPATFAAGVLTAPFIPASFSKLFSGGGWKTISFEYCFGYDVGAFPMPPEVTLPAPTNCSGRFRLLNYGSRDIGYEIDITVPGSTLENIPAAWREPRRIDGGRWKIEGRTEVSFDAVLEFTFLDRDGFEVASRTSEPVTVWSGKVNQFSGRLAAPPTEEAEAIMVADGHLSVTRCHLCASP